MNDENNFRKWKILGRLIVGSVFVSLFIFIVFINGIIAAVVIFGGVFGLASLIWVGVVLSCSNNMNEFKRAFMIIFRGWRL